MMINKSDTFSMDSNILVSTRPFTPPPSRLSNRPEESTALSPRLETTDPFLLMEPCKGTGPLHEETTNFTVQFPFLL